MIAAGQHADLLDRIYSSYMAFKEGKDLVLMEGPGPLMGETELDAQVGRGRGWREGGGSEEEQQGGGMRGSWGWQPGCWRRAGPERKPGAGMGRCPPVVKGRDACVASAVEECWNWRGASLT